MQGTIGILAICIVLGIFFPFLIPVFIIIWILNMVCKASEAHDKLLARRAEMPKEPETLAGPFIAEPPENVF